MRIWDTSHRPVASEGPFLRLGRLRGSLAGRGPCLRSVVMSEFEESFEYCRKRVGPKLAFACAVDGSRVSKKALDLSVRLLSKREGGTLDLLHVEEPKAEVLLSGEHIRKECDLVTSSAEVPAEFHTIPKSEDASVTETLAKEAERHQADILVVGATGLKIEQGAVHADSFSVMGSVSDGARASRP